MAFDFGRAKVSWDAACEDKISEGVELCPFLRNIGVTTSFAFSNMKFPVPAPVARGPGRGPIFEDGPGFENSFRLFHGKDGVVPLSRSSGEKPVQPVADVSEAANLSFHPLSARAAAISLSPFGPAGPFGFDGFMANINGKKSNKKQPKKEPKEPQSEKDHKSKMEAHMHEAMGSEWLATGQCPIAKSFRAISGVLPLVSNMLPKLPKGMKYRCPPAIVAARAALAKTSAVKALRPQALPTKVLAIGMLGMALNVPLGVWREHTKKFSPQWFLAVHATIPFIAMLRKAVVMPKYAIAFTIGSAVLGQAVGARAERMRLANLKMEQSQVLALGSSTVASLESSPVASLASSQVPEVPAISSKIDFPSVLEKSSVEDVQKENEKRFSAGVPLALQCGSESLMDRPMSSFSLPVSVS
ncbi:hypothetical protein M758_12G144900 [Ceratodon purpureus]|uniref:Uncharacterized protein n=1 Tax=Ceratodon purpureus TaxID=3225 RepID=A0A8T0G7Q7_CERPU|nr:hypothetical protein KC19_12G141200 [Ceratodon purpureus]KAG0599339.1 hypothetical protein M758_12G144900 [Ceratodon purpureus]